MTSKFRVNVTHAHDFGIWTHHWTIMAQYAHAHDYVLCVRAGKPAAIHWIREDFPAKPFALKCKVDRTVGLLFAVTDDDRLEAKEYGFPLLESVAGRPGEFVATLNDEPAFDGKSFSLQGDPWLRRVSELGSMATLDGLVMHPVQQRPITSDYDLAAIIDTERFSFFDTFGSMAGGVSCTNAYTQAIGDALNRIMGSERIMHGSEVQFVREIDSAEHIVEFHPDGTAEAWAFTGTVELDNGIREVVLRYAPEAAEALGPQ